MIVLLRMFKPVTGNKTTRVLFIILGIWIVKCSLSNAHILYAPLHIESSSIRLMIKNAITFAPMMAFLLCLHKPSKIVQSLGLSANILKGLGFAALCCMPLFIGFPIIGSFNNELTLDALLRKVILAAFFEEVVFRGFMFGQLFRYGRIGFIWAAFIPAILFGVGHLYQGYSLSSSLMAFAVTALGSIYFSWVYVECNFNLWIPIGLHLFMNLCWTVFPVEGSETAVGTLMPNILRIISIALTVALIVIYKRRRNSRVFNYPMLSV